MLHQRIRKWNPTVTLLSGGIFNIISDTQVRHKFCPWHSLFLTVMLKIPWDLPLGREQKAESCKQAIVLGEAEIKTRCNYRRERWHQLAIRRVGLADWHLFGWNFVRMCERKSTLTGRMPGKQLPKLSMMHFSHSHSCILKIHGAASASLPQVGRNPSFYVLPFSSGACVFFSFEMRNEILMFLSSKQRFQGCGGKNMRGGDKELEHEQGYIICIVV